MPMNFTNELCNFDLSSKVSLFQSSSLTSCMSTAPSAGNHISIKQRCVMIICLTRQETTIYQHKASCEGVVGIMLKKFSIICSVATCFPLTIKMSL